VDQVLPRHTGDVPLPRRPILTFDVRYCMYYSNLSALSYEGLSQFFLKGAQFGRFSSANGK
jgi:hypothetical protein